jgi:tetratricopeptide (TPR) repeat protein
MKFLLSAICFFLTAALLAQPVPPSNTALLPLGKTLPLPPAMQLVLQQLSQQADNDALRLKAAQLYLQGARKPGFDDWFHQAQALLNAVAPKNQHGILYWLLRADLQQQQHQFALALQNLQIVFNQDPANTNASLMAARIHLAQHNIAGAQQACAR